MAVLTVVPVQKSVAATIKVSGDDYTRLLALARTNVSIPEAMLDAFDLNNLGEPLTKDQRRNEGLAWKALLDNLAVALTQDVEQE